MLRKLKKSVAVVLVATFIMSMFVIAPSAAEKENENVAVNTSDYSISGYDSFGEMLASDISDKNEEIMQANEEFSLLDVTVNGNVAMVDYEAKEDCTILVAVYDDVTEKMLASGKSQALANQDSVEVSIETEVMPEYFILKAFMLDDNNAPLTGCYVEERYTEGVQQVVELEASQFDEERVLNLDENMSTNFAVYNENTILVEASEQNIPAEIDEDNETYVFTMCDEKLTSLTAGDIFVYEYEDGNVLIVKIKEISIDGTTVTITGDSNVELEDVFDYVKIEANQNADNATVDMSNADAGVTYEENVPQKADKACASVGKKWDGEVEAGKEFNIGFGKDDDKIKGTVGAKIVFGVEVEVYINNRFWKYKSHYIDFDFSYGVYFTGKIEVEVSKEISKKLADIQVPIVTGVNFNLSPQLEAKFSGSIEFTASIEGSLGFKASLGKGVQGKSESPDFSCSLELSGDLFIGLNINPGLSIIDRRVAKVELECTAGLNLHAETKVGTSKDDDDCGCKVCIKGKLSPQIKFGASIELATKTVGSLEVTFDLFSKDFYYSVDHKRFGFGECPYVSGGGSTDTTVPAPTGGEPATLPRPTTNPNPGPQPTDPQPTTKPGPTIVDSGTCGNNATWELWSDGKLNINGSGDMDDYSYDNRAPWYKNCELIKTVNIADGITSIGTNAFWNCINLVNISIPVGIKSIASFTFYNCSSLTSITIPDSVTYIGSSAFSGCSNLTSITIPDSVTYIGQSAFSGCSSLTSVTIPDSVTEIGSSTFFNCSSLTSVTIPDSVTGICSSAFSGCSSLTSVTIPDGVTEIDTFVFLGCSSLTSVTIPDSVTGICSRAFSGCSSLTSITIPDSVTLIAESVFSGCSSLTSITIPDSVTYIAQSAFSGCSSLASITIPDSVTYIGEGAFIDTSYYNNADNWENDVLYIGKYLIRVKPSSETIYNIKPGTLCIAEHAFSGCTNLSNITIPNGVTEIGLDAFYNCTSLTSITIPDSVTQIDRNAFSGCTSLTSITIPDSVTYIGSSAFSGCSNLTSITIPDSVTYIGQLTFSGCSNLTSITIPDSVTSIGQSAFYRCISLKSITIPKSVVSIDYGAFNNSNLQTIYGYSGSYAETYANENGYQFIALDGEAVSSNDISTVSAAHISKDDNINNVSASRTNMIADTVSAQTLESATEISKITAEYSKTPYADYIIAVVKDPNAEDVLSADNLMYINQYTADKDGKISASMPVSDDVGDDYEVLIFGPEKTAAKGDVNGDGKVNIDDVTLIQKYIANMAELDSIQFKAADLNGDENANIDDVTIIQKFLAGMVVFE